MVEHQSGTLNDLEELKPLVKDEQLTEEVIETQETEVTPTTETETPVEAEAEAEAVEAVEDVEEQETNENVIPDLDSEDWMSKLRDDELFNGPNGPAPLLRGLRRLAKPYVKREESRVNHLVVVPREIVRTVQTFNSNGDLMSTSEELGHHHYPMASVTFFIEDWNGRTFSDSADAYYSNCNELGLFPTAVASARAEARTLRKMLGIAQHAAEEMSDKDAAEELAPDDDGAIKPEQAKLIDKILAEKALEEFSLKDLLDTITTREIYAVEELTTGEARKALRVLNDQKKKSKRKKTK